MSKTKSSFVMQSKYSILIFVSIIVIAYYLNACKKSPQYPLTPQLEFAHFSKDTVDQGDSLLITVKFKDGDGDLGFTYTSSEPCDLCRLDSSNSCLFHPTWSLFLLDKRDSCLEFFRMPYLESNPQNPSIEGQIDIEKYNMCCKKRGFIACTALSTGTIDTAYYYVILKDRAGNFSNSLPLPPLYVRCDR